MTSSTVPRRINVTAKGARRFRQSEEVRASWQATAQETADATGDVVEFRAPDGTVLITAKPQVSK